MVKRRLMVGSFVDEASELAEIKPETSDAG